MINNEETLEDLLRQFISPVVWTGRRESRCGSEERPNWSVIPVPRRMGAVRQHPPGRHQARREVAALTAQATLPLSTGPDSYTSTLNCLERETERERGIALYRLAASPIYSSLPRGYPCPRRAAAARESLREKPASTTPPPRRLDTARPRQLNRCLAESRSCPAVSRCRVRPFALPSRGRPHCLGLRRPDAPPLQACWRRNSSCSCG